MTYYADLTPYAYDRDNGDPRASGTWQGLKLLNVGWLHRGKAYAKSAPLPGLVEALTNMTRTHRAQQTRGFHLCPWCTSPLSARRLEVPRGSAEIRVKGDGVAYAAPELIAHYVQAHDYQPPTDFVHAVLSSGQASGAGQGCPSPRPHTLTDIMPTPDAALPGPIA
ncbi:hypothetical protein [Streptomyces sp. N35]|uniref:DUF7919 family protein n=1 Tax=Streptomyces sp. N35 TaxID=2795730 RepID=UPI0018F474EF|nr:hypothetical protein [Streptomyces sp. N35]